MTIEREYDPEATLEMPRPDLGEVGSDIEEIDPEKTLVRESWETTVIRRVAPRVAAMRDAVAEDSESRFGWETASLRRLSIAMAREQAASGGE